MAIISPLMLLMKRDLTTRVRAVLDQRKRRGRAGAACLAVAWATASLFVIAVSSIQIVTSTQVPAAVPLNAASPARLQFGAASLRPGGILGIDGWGLIKIHTSSAAFNKLPDISRDHEIEASSPVRVVRHYRNEEKRFYPISTPLRVLDGPDSRVSRESVDQK